MNILNKFFKFNLDGLLIGNEFIEITGKWEHLCTTPGLVLYIGEQCEENRIRPHPTNEAANYWWERVIELYE